MLIKNVVYGNGFWLKVSNFILLLWIFFNKALLAVKDHSNKSNEQMDWGKIFLYLWLGEVR